MPSSHPEELRLQLLNLVAQNHSKGSPGENRNHAVVVVACQLSRLGLLNESPVEVFVGCLDFAVGVLECFHKFGKLLAVELGDVLEDHADITRVETPCELLVVSFILQNDGLAEIVDRRCIQNGSPLL